MTLHFPALAVRAERPAALAGLWERWQPPEGDAVETCTVLTMGANALMQPIHDRMPVVIAPESYATWLSAETPAGEARGLMPAWDPAEWTAHRVSARVNAPGNDDAGCVAEDD